MILLSRGQLSPSPNSTSYPYRFTLEREGDLVVEYIAVTSLVLTSIDLFQLELFLLALLRDKSILFLAGCTKLRVAYFIL